MDSTKLLDRLKSDYPHLQFRAGSSDSWSPQKQEIVYREPINPFYLLHEVSHAILGHNDYRLDIELLKIEVDAWVKAREIAPRYDLDIDSSLVDSCLETYKRWLLKQSLCPECSLVGIQSNDRLYSCPNCQTRWSVPLKLGCALNGSQDGKLYTDRDGKARPA